MTTHDDIKQMVLESLFNDLKFTGLNAAACVQNPAPKEVLIQQLTESRDRLIQSYDNAINIVNTTFIN
ncbi:MAG: hypothetical protein ACRCYD_05520 [Plesiomonas sp.]